MQAFAYNEKGPRRHNEDRFCLVIPGTGSLVAAVADGMGGHAGGDVAASIAIQTVKDEFKAGTSIFEVPRLAHEAILGAARKKRELGGMGTTLTAVVILDDILYGAHVGDSHAYLVRDGEVFLLSEDHSVSGLLLAKGVITELHSKSHPLKNQVVFACGMVCDEFYTQTFDVALRDGDKILLSTDGLHDNLFEEDIAETAMFYDDGPHFNNLCKKLIALSRFRGLTDNATLVALSYTDEDSQGVEQHVFDESLTICLNCSCDDKDPCQIASDNSTCHWAYLFEGRGIGICSDCAERGVSWDDDEELWTLIR